MRLGVCKEHNAAIEALELKQEAGSSPDVNHMQYPWRNRHTKLTATSERQQHSVNFTLHSLSHLYFVSANMTTKPVWRRRM